MTGKPRMGGKIADWLCEFGPLLIVLVVHYTVTFYDVIPPQYLP